MKKLFSTNHSLKNFDLVILLGRVAIASLMLVHGLPKLAMIFSGEPVQFPGVFGMSPEFSLALTVFAEVFCSLLYPGGLWHPHSHYSADHYYAGCCILHSRSRSFRQTGVSYSLFTGLCIAVGYRQRQVFH